MKAQVKSSKFLVIGALLTVYLIQGSSNGLNPCLASLGGFFSDIDFNTVLLIASLPGILGIIGSGIMGSVIAKFGYKKTALFGCALNVITGIAPYFFYNNFMMILIVRVIWGFSYGILYGLGTSAISAYFEGDSVNTLIGWGSTFNNVGSIVYSLLAAWLLTSHIRNIWLVNLIMVIPLVFFLLICDAPALPEAEVSADAPKEKSRFPAATWFYVFFIGILLLFFYPIFVSISMLMAEKGFGGASESSVVITMTAVTGMISGATFGTVFKVLKKYLMPLGSIFTAIGFLLIYISGGLMVLYIGCAIAGIGFYWMFPLVFASIAEVTPSAQNAKANGIAIAFMTFCGTIAVYVHPFLAGIFNQNANTFPFLDGVVFFVICAVFFLVKAVRGK